MAKKKTTIKQTIGTMKAVLIFSSPTYPIIKGNIAPPIIAIIISEEPIFVSSPMPLIPKANMVGNIIDIKKLTPTTKYTLTIPELNVLDNKRNILITA